MLCYVSVHVWNKPQPTRSAFQQKMTTQMTKNSQQIRRDKSECVSVQFTYSFYLIKSNQFDDPVILCFSLLPIILLDHNYAGYDRRYALNMKMKTESEFECVDCGKVFAIRSRLLRHKTENCGTKPKKEKSCAICGKLFTYNGLRDHYRNYTVEQRKFGGKHYNFTADDHWNLLKQLKP